MTPAKRRTKWLARTMAAGLLLAAACLPGLGPGLAAGAATTVASAPDATGPADEILNGVDCLSLTACVAVGSTSLGPLAQVWNGSTWTVTPTPAATGTLSSISCASFSACVAVGSYASSSAVMMPLTEAWNGSTWQMLPAVGTTGSLTGVSCASSTMCVAVGAEGVAGTKDSQPVSALWNGTAWTVLDTPAPSSPSSVFSAVSCADATDCTAVGWSDTTTEGGYAPLAEDWTSGAWQIQPVPSNPSQYPPRLLSVSCPAASTCFAVGGDYWGADLVQWNGSSWQQIGIGSPVPATPLLDTISCESVSRCVAYGTAGSGSTEVPVGAELYDGDWNTFGIAGGTTYPLAASCVNASNCAVTGYYVDPSSQQRLRLFLLTDGSGWSVPAVPFGYQVLQNGGGVASFHTDMYGSQPGAVVGIAPDINTGGYWVLYADGGVQNFNAPWLGSEVTAGETPVGIAPDTKTGGYWILNSNGGVNNYGAPWYGSERGHLTSKPVGITSGPPGDPGYWILNANGGVANYGEPWHGSEKGHVTGSVVGIASDQYSTGYWILNSVGGVTGFDAPWRGSEAGHLTHPVVAIAGSLPTGGYWILNSVGGISGFGAAWYGSLAGTKLSGPPVGLTAP